MYGSNVHQAVVAAAEKESGITIHFVNEHYDEGATILQAHCSLLPEDDHETLAEKIHKLEHYFFPRTIEFLLDNA
jgi:phosphoribosylglycinamide formyltransferase-1